MCGGVRFERWVVGLGGEKGALSLIGGVEGWMSCRCGGVRRGWLICSVLSFFHVTSCRFGEAE